MRQTGQQNEAWRRDSDRFGSLEQSAHRLSRALSYEGAKQ
jgi:hypothetical protein